MSNVSTIKGIRALLREINREQIRTSAGEDPLMPSDLKDESLRRIDKTLFSLDDLLDELAEEVANKSIDMATQATLPFDGEALTRQEQLFPDAEKAKNTGIKYHGGVILFKNATGKHLIASIEYVDENLAKMQESATRTRSQKLAIYQEILSDPDIHNGGQAIDKLAIHDAKEEERNAL